jgi:hypothetical protein
MTKRGKMPKRGKMHGQNGRKAKNVKISTFVKNLHETIAMEQAHFLNSCFYRGCHLKGIQFYITSFKALSEASIHN